MARTPPPQLSIFFKSVDYVHYIPSRKGCANKGTRLVLCMSTAAPSTSGVSIHNTRGSGKIQWDPCGDLGVNGTTKLECGNITVPLDYTEPDSGETLDLQILKAPAPNQPSKGSVFFNFGGPGASGIPQMSLMGSVLSVYVNLDILKHFVWCFSSQG